MQDKEKITMKLKFIIEAKDAIVRLTEKRFTDYKKLREIVRLRKQVEAEYADRYNTLVERYEKATARAEKLQKLIAERQEKADAIGAFIFEVHEIGPLLEFDEALWFKLIDHVTAYHDGRLVFCFTNGSDIEA